MMTKIKLIKYNISTDKYRNIKDLYECFCGSVFTARRAAIVSKHTNSCGCLKSSITSKRMSTHGKSKTSEFHTWQALIQRCTNPNNSRWKHYGGRSITVDLSWLESFENFYRDMGPRQKGLSIDRIDNDKGYCKDNCRWTTTKVQNLNKRQRGKNA